MSEPALPWANPVASEAEQVQANVEAQRQPVETKNDKSTFLALEKAGIEAGGRVEVKWQVEPEEGEAYFRWWGATIVGPSDKQDAERSGAPVYELLYDAHDDFEQERGHVIFTTEHTLRQLDQTEELAWRLEGDTWEDDSDVEEEGEERMDGEALLTMDDLRRISDQQLEGRNLEELEAEAFQSMEPNKRIAVAAGFRDFADHLISFLRERVSGESGNVVVTKEDVECFKDALLKKQRTQ